MDRVHNFFLVGTVLLWAVHCPARTLRVPADWQEIGAAMQAAADGDVVLVAPGTYHESELNFSGKAIMVRSENPFDPATVDATVVDAQSQGSVFVFESGEDTTSVLAGFTLTGGESPTSLGGGIRIESSGPRIAYCDIRGNTGDAGGGGMYIRWGSPVISDCVFDANSCDNGGAVLMESSFADFRRCMFSDNFAAFYGGGVDMYGSGPRFVACDFRGNTVGDYGGAVNCDDSAPLFESTRFLGNHAWLQGGVMYANEAAPVLRNCTVAFNTGGSDAIVFLWESPAIVEASIVYDNHPASMVDATGDARVRYSDIEGGWDGVGNIDADPQFISYYGQPFGLLPGSPCIDTGLPNLEDGINWSRVHPGYGRQNSAAADMGVYGGPTAVRWLPLR